MSETQELVEWVRSYEDRVGIEFIEDLGGISWFDAPAPPRRHECSAQTRGYMAGGVVQRCACGAIRLSSQGSWMERWGRVAEAPPRRRFWLFPRRCR